MFQSLREIRGIVQSLPSEGDFLLLAGLCLQCAFSLSVPVDMKPVFLLCTEIVSVMEKQLKKKHLKVAN